MMRDHIHIERIGMLLYGGNVDYWRRGVRTVYEGDIRYEWNTQERGNRIEVTKLNDGKRMSADPAECELLLFDEDPNTYVETTKPRDGGPDVDRQTGRQFADLRYKV